MKQSALLVTGDKTAIVTSEDSEDDEEEGNENRKYVEGIRNYIQGQLDDESETQGEDENKKDPEMKLEAQKPPREVTPFKEQAKQTTNTWGKKSL